MKCVKHIIMYIVFDMLDTSFVQKPWFLLHSVGVALCSPRGPEANFDECFGKSKETDAQPIAPETHSTSEIHASGNEKATNEQRTSNERATHKQRTSQHFTNPYPSLEILLKKNLDRTTEKTEPRRQKTEDRTPEKQNHSMTV